MKKLLIGLTVLFSFVFISNVNAEIISETYTIKEDILNSELYFNDYGTYYNGHTTDYDLLIASGKLKSFHEEAMKRGYKYYFYTSSSIFMWNDEDIKIVMSLQTLDTNNGYTLEYRLVNPNNSNYVFYWLHHWINDNKMGGLYEDSERFHLNVGIEFNTKDYNQYGLSKYHFPGFNTNADIYYYPSIANSTPYNSKLVFYSSISINGKTYNDGDVIYSQKKEPEIYQYNEEIDTTNLSYIRVDFDTTGATYEDYHFSILENVSSKLKEAYFEKSYDWGICIDENTCYDNYVHRDAINYTSNFNMYSVSSPFKVEDSEHGFYDETQELDYYYTYYDVSNINDLVTLNIDSTVPFSVSFGQLEDYTDTFTKINLKNYAGIVLYPISSLYNGDYNFYLDNADVDVHHYYNSDLVNIYKNVTASIYYINSMEYYDRNRFYLIENNKINDDSYISFNTSYFSYQLVENSYDDIVIVNPNTNNSENINSIDDSNLLFNSRNEYNNISTFIDEINETLQYVHNVFTMFYNKLPGLIQGLLIFVFNILCIFMLLRMGGWLG